MKKLIVFLFTILSIMVLSSCAGGNISPYETIRYGKYPNKNVYEKELLEKLDALDSSSVNEYGYYVYEGNEYAKIKATPYSGKAMYFNNNSQVKEGKTYYFLVEPISWRILKKEDGMTYLMSEKVLDCYNFITSEKISSGDLSNTTISYGTSYIRTMLNSAFSIKSFKDETNKPIKTKIEVLDSLKENPKYYEDTVWLPSYFDLNNENYSFNSEDDRYTQLTDYAKARGADCFAETSTSYYYNSASYITLTESAYNPNAFFYVDFYGKMAMVNKISEYKDCGIRPCICIKSID